MHDVVFRRFLGVDEIVEIVNGATIDCLGMLMLFSFFFITQRRIPKDPF